MTRAVTAGRTAVALLMAGLLAGCGEKAAAPEPVRPVLSMVVSPLGAATIGVVGTVQPRYQTDYGFRVLGRLVARPVNVGDSVTKGQLLAAIDATAAEMAVRSLQGALTTAQGSLLNATGTVTRQRTLIETGANTQATLDSAEQSYASAQAGVVRAQADLAKAREQLTYTKSIADYAGVVAAVGAQVGQIVAPGQTVVTVARPDVREAVIDIAVELASRLEVGMPLTVSLQIDPKTRVEGKVREIGPQFDSQTRLSRVRVTLDSPPDTFRLGSTVTTYIPGNSRHGFRLPAAAILTQDGKSRVWIVDPGSKSVTARDVVVVANEDGSVTVTSGIDDGMRVVTAGVHHLKEGQKVRLEKEDA
ncbi:efflux RND transporter periplasmic adaptor subunit [Rhodopseudomonas boonkerdii]|uniref:efflux RND transporter periplasmic adaptor subunit n=1 Tax=Rhodopseudomonas boonkerdii TaxID=475937 RepID=UPI003221DA14